VSYLIDCLKVPTHLEATGHFAELFQLERLVAPARQWGSAMNLSPAAYWQCLLGLLVVSSDLAQVTERLPLGQQALPQSAD
jgi:hypothetical protein